MVTLRARRAAQFEPFLRWIDAADWPRDGRALGADALYADAFLRARAAASTA
jgi:hypothetical protein